MLDRRRLALVHRTVETTDGTGLFKRGAIETRGVFFQETRPLSLYRHDLAEGAEIRIDQPTVGQMIYVLAGFVSAAGELLPRGHSHRNTDVDHLGTAVVSFTPIRL